jgi:hypothetical protein
MSGGRDRPIDPSNRTGRTIRCAVGMTVLAVALAAALPAGGEEFGAAPAFGLSGEMSTGEIPSGDTLSGGTAFGPASSGGSSPSGFFGFSSSADASRWGSFVGVPNVGERRHLASPNELIGHSFSGLATESDGRILELGNAISMQFSEIEDAGSDLTFDDGNVNAFFDRRKISVGEMSFALDERSSVSLAFSRLSAERFALFPAQESDSLPFDYRNANSAFTIGQDLGAVEINGASIETSLFGGRVTIGSDIAFSSATELASTPFVDMDFGAQDGRDAVEYDGGAQRHEIRLDLRNEERDGITLDGTYLSVDETFVSDSYSVTPGVTALDYGLDLDWKGLAFDLRREDWRNDRDGETRDNLDMGAGYQIDFGALSFDAGFRHESRYIQYGNIRYDDCYYDETIECEDDEDWYDWDGDDWEEDVGYNLGFEVASLWDDDSSDIAQEWNELGSYGSGYGSYSNLTERLTESDRFNLSSRWRQGDVSLAVALGWADYREATVAEDEADERRDRSWNYGVDFAWRDLSLNADYRSTERVDSSGGDGTIQDLSLLANYRFEPLDFSADYRKHAEGLEVSARTDERLRLTVGFDLDAWRRAADEFETTAAPSDGETGWLYPSRIAVSRIWDRDFSAGEEFDIWGTGAELAEWQVYEDQLRVRDEILLGWNRDSGDAQLILARTVAFEDGAEDGIYSQAHGASFDYSWWDGPWQFNAGTNLEYVDYVGSAFEDTALIVGSRIGLGYEFERTSFDLNLRTEGRWQKDRDAGQAEMSQRVRLTLSADLSGLLPGAMVVDGTAPSLKAVGSLEYDGGNAYSSYSAAGLNAGFLIVGSTKF